MAVRPCAESVRCPGDDSPVENYSSEADDPLRFIALGFGPPDKRHWHDPNDLFTAQGCLGICYSTVSQQDADFCAALQAYLCEHDCNPDDPNCVYSCPGDPRCSCQVDDPDPGCPFHCPGDPRCPDECPPEDPTCQDHYHCPGDPRCITPKIYFNQAQSCTYICPDGNPFNWFVEAHKFAADSQLLADRMAQSYCKQQVEFHHVCLNNIPPTALVGTAYKNPDGTGVRIIASGHTVNGRQDLWELTGGALPPGLTLHLDKERFGAIALDGVPTKAGSYEFSVRVTTPARDYMLKTFFITVTENFVALDMPLDQAVYDPVRDVIFGVRGGYLFEFNNSGSLTRTQKFRSVSFSDSSIAYHAGSDRLIVSCWNDPGWEYSNGFSPYRTVYKINPATLTVESTLDMLPFAIGLSSGIYSGPHQLNPAGDNILGIYYSGTPSTPNAAAFYWNPSTDSYVDGGAGGIAGFQPVSLYASWHEAIQAASGLAVYVTDPQLGRVNLVDATNLQQDNHGGTDIWYVQWPTPSPTLAAPIGIAECPTNFTLYITSRTNQLFRCSSAIIGAAQAPLASITLPGTAPNPWRVRYNPNDQKLYVPCYGENTVVVVDPASNAVVATKTGFDFAFDVVFTAPDADHPTGKVFAVQHGIVGLKEVV